MQLQLQRHLQMTMRKHMTGSAGDYAPALDRTQRHHSSLYFLTLPSRSSRVRSVAAKTSEALTGVMLFKALMMVSTTKPE